MCEGKVGSRIDSHERGVRSFMVGQRYRAHKHKMAVT